jgi:hypothetical protein
MPLGRYIHIPPSGNSTSSFLAAAKCHCKDEDSYKELLELAKLGLIIALIWVLEKMIGRAIRERRDFGSL